MLKTIIFFFCAFNLHSGEIFIDTPDKCKLSAYENITSSKSYVLIEIHGLGSNKDEWQKLNDSLKKEKIGYLAIDLRGHNKSVECNNEKIDYRNFTASDWQKILIDIKAAYDYLSKKIDKSKIVFVGASIGANAAIISGETLQNPVIALSPGLNYAGLEPAISLSKIRNKILIIYSENDNYSAFSVNHSFKAICKANDIKCSIKKAKTGHGVEIFKSEQLFIKELINWVKNLKNK